MTTSPVHPGPRDDGSHVSPERYLTSVILGIGGVIKQRPEDFLVEEIPLYEPCGSGEHIYLFVEKRHMSTGELVSLLSSHFGVPRHAICYAGLKDKLAVTRQVMSVHAPGRKIEDFPMIQHDRAAVLWTDYHANKLRPGHLRANRFSIRVRATPVIGVLHARRTLAHLALHGVPNRVGEQRFGPIGNNHLVGRAIVLGRDDEALGLLLGPSERAGESSAPAREAFARADYRAALDAFPRAARAEQSALRALVRGADARSAVHAIDAQGRRFFVSAFQSAVFNAVLDARVEAGTLASLHPGDLAQKHDNRAIFAVDDAAALDPTLTERLTRLEISPTGPMWGTRMMRASGNTDAAEIAALERAGVSLADLDAFDRRSAHLIDGARRPLRVPVTDPQVEAGADEHGEYVRCAFDLPRGAFATVVLREVMKPQSGHVAGAEDEPE